MDISEIKRQVAAIVADAARPIDDRIEEVFSLKDSFDSEDGK